MIYKRYLSFSRRKISFFVLPLLVVSGIFLLYQILMFKQIAFEVQDVKFENDLLIRGTLKEQKRFYKPDDHDKFVCIHSLEQIDFNKVNDDYCDCLDGSDEPGTNACSNGIFYCSTRNKYPTRIHSSMVNDGICDCCDGSDEWKNNFAYYEFKNNKERELEVAIKKSHSSCPNIC